MADPYIDQYETLIYGKYACEQMEKVCLGRIKELDGMVKFAVAQQAQANADMKAVLDKQPKPLSLDDLSEVLAETRDTILRFGSYLDSLKGRPVNPKVFFRGETPGELSRRRLVKLAAGVEHIANEIPNHPAITDPTWAKDFKALSKKLNTMHSAQRDAKVERADLGPEVAAQRDKWLATYAANKLLIRGLLSHLGKPDLLPLVFDDLAEIHRTSGVTDALPAPAPSKDPEAKPG